MEQKKGFDDVKTLNKSEIYNRLLDRLSRVVEETEEELENLRAG